MSIDLQDQTSLKEGTPILDAINSQRYNEALELIKGSSKIDEIDDQHRTPLHLLSSHGKLDLIIELLKKSQINLELETISGETPLFITAENGHLDIVKYLIYQGADINHKNNNLSSTLHAASFGGHLEIVEHLVFCGSDINQGNKTERTPLYYAAYSGHLEIVKYLISQGADINYANVNKSTPLFIACCYGHLEIIKYLISIGSNPRERSDQRSPELRSGRSDQRSPELRSGRSDQRSPELYSNRSSGAALSTVNHQNIDSCTNLYVASEGGHLEVVKYLISRGADVNRANKEGFNPLHVASEKGHLEIVKYLVSQGADVNQKNKIGFNPLYYSMDKNYTKISNYLLQKGADPFVGFGMGGRFNRAFSIVDPDVPPLITMATIGNITLLSYYIGKSRNINVVDNEGRTALHHAILNNQVPSYQALLENKADPTLKNNHGKSFYDYFRDKGEYISNFPNDVLQMIIEYL